MDAIAPAPITTFTTTSTDGRHRTFTFTMPQSRGDPIQTFVIRQSSDPAGTVQFDYVVSCSAPVQLCDGSRASTTHICLPNLQCSPGDEQTVTVGADLHPADPFYVHPMVTYQWHVIAINSNNAGCYEPGQNNCDSKQYGGWSATLSRPQGALHADATPRASPAALAAAPRSLAALTPRSPLVWPLACRQAPRRRTPRRPSFATRLQRPQLGCSGTHHMTTDRPFRFTARSAATAPTI